MQLRQRALEYSLSYVAILTRKLLKLFGEGGVFVRQGKQSVSYRSLRKDCPASVFLSFCADIRGRSVVDAFCNFLQDLRQEHFFFVYE
ncbi:MAG TPA: hypothetical protein VKX25_15420 [Bryobacteraceae bacterium]|nr:hypothetical protein [Bryobacteraceae bacterium]